MVSERGVRMWSTRDSVDSLNRLGLDECRGT